MKIRLIITPVIFLLFSTSVLAQKNFTEDADLAFEAEAYYTAVDLYKKAYSREKSKGKKAEILYDIAECYRFIEDVRQAETWYQKALKAQYAEKKIHLHLGEVLKAQGNFVEAQEEFEKYLNQFPGDKHTQREIESCKQAESWKQNPTRHEVTNEVLLNSKQYDFSPTFADKKNESLIFTSSRIGSAGAEIDSRTGENYTDLYYTKRDKKGKWSLPVLLNEEVNSPANEGAACLNSRKNLMYFTRCIVDKKHETGCEILQSKKMGNNWGPAEVSPVKLDSVTNGHPSISKDDALMFFAADMAGGKGGKDIWFLKYDKQAKTWGEPINAGAEVNTDYDEMFPFIHDDGSLYFSSNGHGGMGELDIFKAEKTGVDKWGNIENMKYPINSAANDYGIIFEGKKEKGYFTSNRQGAGGRGGDDIYSFHIPPLVFIIKGKVTDVVSGEPIAEATVKIVGNDGLSVEVQTDKAGEYAFAQIDGGKEWYIKKDVNYTIFVSKAKHLNSKGRESTLDIEESTTFIHDFGLQPFGPPPEGVEGGGGIRFPEVLYAFGKADLKPESKDSLNFLYQVLIDNPTITIELSAHTDSRGSNAANLKLSNRRAESCVRYLIDEKHIPADRLTPKGYGETKLMFKDTDIAQLGTEEEREAMHQKNRRTVFHVLTDTYVPKGGADTNSEGASETNEDLESEPGN